MAPIYDYLSGLDEEYSAKHNLPKSVRLTTVQPSGTLSLLPGVTPGIHPSYAKFYIRRVRFRSTDPLVDTCRKRGYKVQWDVGLDGQKDRTSQVVEFPCKSPDNAILASEMTAVDQLEWIKRMQTEWADNAVSVTVYYQMDELTSIQEWLEKNYKNSIKSVSFLLHTDHNFPLPPYEEITEEEYDKSVRKIDLSIPLVSVPADSIDFDDCNSGVCPIK